MLRRGRCGRLFAKYVQRSIFEDTSSAAATAASADGPYNNGNLSDNENNEEDKKQSSSLLKKRSGGRRRYQDLYDYLYREADTIALEGSAFQGLLLRDQKYLRKNMHKLCQLSVKESASRLIKRHQ